MTADVRQQLTEALDEVERSALAGAEPGPSRLSGRTAASIPQGYSKPSHPVHTAAAFWLGTPEVRG
jgi:hypothetical protein